MNLRITSDDEHVYEVDCITEVLFSRVSKVYQCGFTLINSNLVPVLTNHVGDH